MNDPLQEAPEPVDHDEADDVGNVAGCAGFLLMGEGALVIFASIPLLLVGGLGFLGLPAGVGIVWAGLVLAGVRRDNHRLASGVTIIAGTAAAFIVMLVSAMASCDSFVNCGSSGSDILLFVLPGGVAAFHIFCAVLLWRRRTQP
jgi:hypothetical protein